MWWRICSGKLEELLHVLLRYIREHSQDDLQLSVAYWAGDRPPLLEPPINAVGVLEGQVVPLILVASIQLIRAEGFQFWEQTPPPPTDPGKYALDWLCSAATWCSGALNIVGFDPYLGYLHVERYDGASFTSAGFDGGVLTFGGGCGGVGGQAIASTDFTAELKWGRIAEFGGYASFLRLYEQKKQSHQASSAGAAMYLSEAFEINTVAKYLMGENDKYPLYW